MSPNTQVNMGIGECVLSMLATTAWPIDLMRIGNLVSSRRTSSEINLRIGRVTVDFIGDCPAQRLDPALGVKRVVRSWHVLVCGLRPWWFGAPRPWRFVLMHWMLLKIPVTAAKPTVGPILKSIEAALNIIKNGIFYPLAL